jgi:hypothetical protein
LLRRHASSLCPAFVSAFPTNTPSIAYVTREFVIVRVLHGARATLSPWPTRAVLPLGTMNETAQRDLSGELKEDRDVY